MLTDFERHIRWLTVTCGIYHIVPSLKYFVKIVLANPRLRLRGAYVLCAVERKPVRCSTLRLSAKQEQPGRYYVKVDGETLYVHYIRSSQSLNPRLVMSCSR